MKPCLCCFLVLGVQSKSFSWFIATRIAQTDVCGSSRHTWKIPESEERAVFHTALATQLESYLNVFQKLFIDLKTVWGLWLLLLFASLYHLVFQNLINTLQRSKIIGHTLVGSQICFTCACNTEELKTCSSLVRQIIADAVVKTKAELHQAPAPDHIIYGTSDHRGWGLDYDRSDSGNAIMAHGCLEAAVTDCGLSAGRFSQSLLEGKNSYCQKP